MNSPSTVIYSTSTAACRQDTPQWAQAETIHSRRDPPSDKRAPLEITSTLSHLFTSLASLRNDFLLYLHFTSALRQIFTYLPQSHPLRPILPWTQTFLFFSPPNRHPRISAPLGTLSISIPKWSSLHHLPSLLPIWRPLATHVSSSHHLTQ